MKKSLIKNILLFCVAVIALHAFIAARYKSKCPMAAEGYAFLSSGSPVATIDAATFNANEGSPAIPTPNGWGFSSLPSSYTAGQTYSITFSNITSPSKKHRGVLIWALKSNGTATNGLSGLPSGYQFVSGSNSITHTSNSAKSALSFNWTPPSGTTGTVTFGWAVVEDCGGASGACRAFHATSTTTISEAVLPVALTDFKAVVTERKTIRLEWKTESEVNTKSFEIERSTDGQKFTPLSILTPKGSNSTYAFIDEKPLADINYYRLKINDLDETTDYSKIISITAKGANKTVLIYPAFVSDGFLNVKTVEERNPDNFGKEEQNTNFSIFNLLGQQVLSGKIAQRIDVSTLAQGAYVFKMGRQQAKFVKQ